ncbi:hypothetical protein A9Q89_12605 [Gammaproteobacteria bacterium 53_120_T64]|nr:hypothetical protein A9Q89_12605 [Gammaproteobacteria bacterium 53_120_T64]
MLFQKNAMFTTARYAFFLGLSALSLSCSASDPRDHPSAIIESDNNLGHPAYALQQLSTYRQLERQLNRIERRSQGLIRVGPLIKNSDNQGLVDIDIPLDLELEINTEVCGSELAQPSIREAVICTVAEGQAGNRDAERIGYSTQGRALLAARLGNPEGTKVLIITQQHGNEPAATEAVLKVLRWLSRAEESRAEDILGRLDLLVIARANPDGGEFDPRRCSIDPVVGTVIDSDCAFIRQNVDPSAGGAFAANSDADFAGVVGRGYDLNRYHHVDLDKPIRPAESQAMVAAVLAFRPDVMLDLHGDLSKTDCELDFASITAGQVLGLLPTAQCLQPGKKADQRLLSIFANATADSPQEQWVQHLGVNVMRATANSFEGSVGRFSQLQLGAGVVNGGGSGGYTGLGIASGGWETLSISKDIRADVVTVVAGEAVVSVNPGLPDPRLLRQQIRINRLALKTALRTLAEFAEQAPNGDSDFCDYPLASGLLVELQAKYWAGAATQGQVLIPIAPAIGLPLLISGNCPDNPGF